MPAELQESFRLIRQHTTTPLAVGEVFSSIHDCQQLIREQLIDYIRTTVVHAGGITHLRRSRTSPSSTTCAPARTARPICRRSAWRRRCTSISRVHNFGIQEYMRHTDETDRVFPHAYRFAAGALHPGEAPGLGVDIDEALAAKYPYDPAYLPTARKLDGTVHSW